MPPNSRFQVIAVYAGTNLKLSSSIIGYKSHGMLSNEVVFRSDEVHGSKHEQLQACRGGDGCGTNQRGRPARGDAAETGIDDTSMKYLSIPDVDNDERSI